MTELPAWWETPRRSAVRAAGWLGILAWTVAGVYLLVHTHDERDRTGYFAYCLPPTWARYAQVAVGAVGVALWVSALTTPPANRTLRVALIAAVFVAWAVLALAIAPSLAQDCSN
jgi:hypothetical protein